MEVWDLYDENRNITGKYWIRGNKVPDGYYHLVIHVWIKNNKGEYLISQRSENRPTFPLKWECVGGSVLKGESSLRGAIREAKEEVGIDLINSNGKLAFSQIRKNINGKVFNDIMDAWIFQYNGKVELKNATTDEVKDIKWMRREEIKALYEKGELVETLSYFFEATNI